MAALRSLGWKVVQWPNKHPLLLATPTTIYAPMSGENFYRQMAKVSKCCVKMDWSVHGVHPRYSGGVELNEPLSKSQLHYVLNDVKGMTWMMHNLFDVDVTHCYSRDEKVQFLQNMHRVHWRTRNVHESIYWKIVGHIQLEEE